MRLVDVYYGTKEQQELKEHFLYQLLSERKPWQNISHKEMPTYEGHVHFVRSKPYKAWYIVEIDNNLVGAMYLSKANEIGIFLLESYTNMGYGSAMLNTLYQVHEKEREFIANISPNNSSSLAFFSNRGYMFKCQTLNDNGDILQYTYRILNPYHAEVLA